MMHARGVLLGAGFTAALFALLSLTPPLAAQDAPLTADSATAGEEERHFGLYVGMSFGSADADDIDTSIQTVSSTRASSALSLDGQDYARASIGWRFAEDQGDLRLTFTGFKETEYHLASTGLFTSVTNGGSSPDPLPWWDLTITDGNLLAIRSAPFWTLADDLNDNQAPDLNEVRYGVPGRVITGVGPDSLQNQVQTVDVMYGREFGTRRFTSHWWAGLRQYAYEGNLISGAWLSSVGIGTGFTDASLLNPLVLFVESSGMGPTGAWGAEVNFFDRGLQLYVQAQSAFVFSSLDVDSGEFFTITRGPTDSTTTLAPARLTESREKSTWQNSIEGGLRLNLRNGLQFEAAFTRYGYLDAVLRPFDISIPQTPNQAPAGSSALFSTQDLIFDSWRVGIAYQF